jgi:rubredoxin
VFTREELQKRLWPDTFVDVDHNLNTAINKIREALGDSSENPRFVETLPRRGYRFIGPVEKKDPAEMQVGPPASDTAKAVPSSRWPQRFLMFGGACLLLIAALAFINKLKRPPAPVKQRTLTRLTFDDGLQFGPTWSPDGHYIAYSSDRGGKLDIWVQQVSGGDAVQVTKGPGHNWQPDWSPDGKYIAYRSERGDGGIYIVPALGGAGLEKKIAAFGYHPRWSPDSTQILFDSQFTPLDSMHRFYVTRLDGSAPREVLRLFLYATKVGLLTLKWEMMCPNCRVPKAEYGTLGSLETRYHCDLCGVDFEADFGRYVELRFSVHPAIRQATDATYCIGGPRNAPHIVAQQYVEPGATQEVAVRLGAEVLRLRALRSNQTARLAPTAT